MNSFTIVAEKAQDRSMVPVSGAWGNPTSDGLQVVAHLFYEYPAVPSSWTIPIENGTPAFANAQELKKADLIREVQTSIVMTPESALLVAGWLKKTAEHALGMRNSKQ